MRHTGAAFVSFGADFAITGLACENTENQE
jgi:hypothetical protein